MDEFKARESLIKPHFEAAAGQATINDCSHTLEALEISLFLSREYPCHSFCYYV